MRLFNVLIAPEGENPIKDKFNKNEFTFVKDSVKINNKHRLLMLVVKSIHCIVIRHTTWLAELIQT